MSENIRVLIVDDLAETRENVRKLLQFESDIEVIGQAATGEQAIQMAKEHQPDIILMDINMPGVDGIGASQKITEMLPTVQIIIMSVQSDSNYLRRAMLAGARDFLTKPFGGDELITTVRRVYSKRPAVVVAPAKTQRGAAEATGPAAVEELEGNILAVFSPKGGSGCTTIAVNLAISLAKKGRKTILLDGSFQFGGVDVMLNMKPVTSVVDATSREGDIDVELINSIVQVHRSGLSVLLAPPKPEMADHITDEGLRKLLGTLRQMYNFIILDTPSTLNDVALTLLDEADKIILVTQQNLPTLKNVSRFFDLTQSLEYGPQKVWMIVNRKLDKQSISVKDISDTLKRPVFMTIPTDDAVMTGSIDKGVPLVVGPNQKHEISMAFAKLADKIIQELGGKATAGKTAVEADKPIGFLGRLFGRRASAGG